MENLKNNVIIVSGGMDSITLLYQERPKYALSFDYGSKHNAKELPRAQYHCGKVGSVHHIIKLDFINELFESSLLKSGVVIPEGHYEDENMKSTVVPFRNGIMLAIACGYAESVKAENVLIGNHSGDHAIYPDCRQDFILAMNYAMVHGTYKKVGIHAPFTNLDKRKIALIGKDLGIDYSKTWTCYKGSEKHCGVCGSCTERKMALEGFDTTVYKV